MRSFPVSTTDLANARSNVDAEKADAATLLRYGLILLASFSVVGTAVELAMLRHWKTSVQFIPWICLGVIAVATAAFAIRPTLLVIRTVRVACVGVALGSAMGVYTHIHENYRAGPLDLAYSDSWPTMSTMSRLWAAVIRDVGQAPTLAPSVLIMAAMCLAIATLRHPALVARVPGGATHTVVTDDAS
jgi:hypothetical protein